MFWRRFLGLFLLMGILFAQSVPQALAASTCNWAKFVYDATVPDGTSFAPGASFTKTWRLKNIGTCVWTTSYSLVFVSGDPMGATGATALPIEVKPGESADLSVNLTAPSASGHYRGYWKLKDASGATFGIGSSAASAFWVDIFVDNSAPIFDFVASAPYAQWKSDAGPLPYPGTSGDLRGFAFQVNNPRLENDSFESSPGLLVVPQSKYNGQIQAVYPEFLIQQGDRFQTLIGCEFGATNCYVTFRVDYMTASGLVKTLWTWKEMHDGQPHRANIDLSPLAGQRVRFILSLLATGYSSGDRAIWGSPRVVRAGTGQPPSFPATLTPLPPPTATPTPFGAPPPISPAACDRASFIADITVPDGTLYAPGAAFTKTWRLKNVGSCAWTTSYKFMYYSGELMNAPTSLPLHKTVMPGETIDLAVNMIAPSMPGKYRGFWILSNPNGNLFGVSANGTMPIWLEINVAGEGPVEAGYDFVKNACAAQWRVDAGILPCPGLDGDLIGFVLPVASPKLEDGSIATSGLLAAPQYKYNGTVSGAYPAFTVQPGDRFQAMVGCEFGAPCYVTFKLDYMSVNGSINNFWSWREQNEGRFYNASVDLTPLAGQSVRFILTIFSTGSPKGDRAIWGAPQIVRAVVNRPPTGTPSPTMTQTPIFTGDWLGYTNSYYGFQFKYPPRLEDLPGQDNNYARIDLPFNHNTNLSQKYLEVIVVENASPCQSPLATQSILQTSENITINGIPFLKQTGGDAGVGHAHQWIAYSTLKGNACISMDFVLHSTNPDVYPTPPPIFDFTAESAVFSQIMSTFAWLPRMPTPTPTPTVVPPPGDWLTYFNPYYGFQFKYLPQAQIVDQDFNFLRMNLPYVPGTNLHEKYLEVIVAENATTCSSPLATQSMLTSSETITINGISFLKETGEDGGAGHLHQWIAYSTLNNNACVSLDFVLHSLNPGNFPTPPPVFDFAAETAVFRDIVATFVWLPPTPSPTPAASLMPTLTAAVDALNAQNFTAARGLMDQTFGFGFWGGEGMFTTPDLAIQQLQTNYIGPNTHLTPDPNKDLTALLGGFNPYSIMGLDPAKAQALFVSGWGLDGKGEAILYVTRRSDGSAYWHSVLIAPWGFATNGSSISHDAFCADTRIPQMIAQLKASMNQSNGDMFSALVSPTHGVDVRLWAYESAVNFSAASAKNIFADATVYNWGSGPRGAPEFGTFKDVIQPKMLDTLNAPNMETYCDNLTKVFPLSDPWPYPDIRYYNLYKPGTPGTDLDFRTWLIGFEYVNDQPYLYAMVNIVWEP
jgi:hypothetical protein